MTTNQPRPATPVGPQSIGRLVSRLMTRSGYGRERASESLAEAWSQAAPVELAATSRPGLVRRGVLEVFVTHSAHVQELGFRKQDVLARLRAALPDAGITDIRCKLLADAGGPAANRP